MPPSGPVASTSKLPSLAPRLPPTPSAAPAGHSSRTTTLASLFPCQVSLLAARRNKVLQDSQIELRLVSIPLQGRAVKCLTFQLNGKDLRIPAQPRYLKAVANNPVRSSTAAHLMCASSA